MYCMPTGLVPQFTGYLQLAVTRDTDTFSFILWFCLIEKYEWMDEWMKNGENMKKVHFGRNKIVMALLAWNRLKLITNFNDLLLEKIENLQKHIFVMKFSTPYNYCF